MDSIIMWLNEWFERIMRHVGSAPSLRDIALVFTAGLVLFAIVRVGIAAREGESDARRPMRRSALAQDDPWLAADALVRDGRFEEAAHALYRGVILTISRVERIRLDPARTSGDYARELRRRSASSLAPFREFTRRFDAAVYGHEGCSEATLRELAALSLPFRPVARAA
ncbi:MAG: DUF4129 domain-containing protein [Gemmatimonadaceae bacterium]